MRCSPWPLPVGSGQRGRSRKDPFSRGRALATRRRAEGLGLDPAPLESACPNASSVWNAALAPRAGQCVLREGTAWCGEGAEQRVASGGSAGLGL